MGALPRLVVASAVTGVLIVATGEDAGSQQPRGVVPVAAGYATTLEELRQWDARVDRMIRAGDLVVVSRRDDRMLAGRTHEYLAQNVAGVPLHGGGIARQLDRGVTVSLLGTMHEGIAIDTTPALSGGEVAARLEQATGATLANARAPDLVVLPLPGGAYALAYRATLGDGRIYFAGAADGGLVHVVEAFRSQAAVGTGAGITGVQKKVSSTRSGDRFEAHDRLRPAEIVTLDMRFDRQRLFSLLLPGPRSQQRWTSSDVAADADNRWDDAAVAGAHVHMGWTYDYLARQLGWHGLDGRNGRIIGLVNNAFGNALAAPPPYGPEGAGVYLFGQTAGEPWVSLDIVAHELMHGVTHFSVSERTANLDGLATDFGASVRLGPRSFTYEGRTQACEEARLPIEIDGQWRMLPALCVDGRYVLGAEQGGSVNEAYSDIVAASVGFFHEEAGATAGYRTGGDQWFGPLRSLEDPRSVRQYPDEYRDRFEFALALDGRVRYYSGYVFVDREFVRFTGDSRYGGDHWNSTILSHAFYLAIEGGTNRTTGLPVDGVGGANRGQIEEIFFRALTELMPQATSFPQAADAIRQSAADLAPGGAAQRAVEQALRAVGLAPDLLAEAAGTGGRRDADRAGGAGGRSAGAGGSGAVDDGGGLSGLGSAGGFAGGFAGAGGGSGLAGIDGGPGSFDVQVSGVGHANYESPHSNPVALLPDGSLLYTVNTPADTVDVIDTATGTVVARVSVGIDPVGVAVRPDGKEVWVSNHVSDSVSVIDADPDSRTRHQVLATLQAFDAGTQSTRFDEPVGIAFASNAKAYVALSSSNRIAVVDVASRQVTSHLQITAQDPRALAVRGDRLYVVPFESNNQTQLSGCWPENIDGELCTFDARKHVTEVEDGNGQTLSLNYVADVVRHPDIPDRDLYVFDTATDELVEVVDTLGTLLYGITVDSAGRVFVAHTEARNDANGKAGTEKHGLAELENRAFLNRLTRVACEGGCGTPEFFDIEPLPPRHPAAGEELATPFGIAVSDDDATLVVTAAASSRLFTVDAETGDVLGRVDVGSMPRGVALETTEAGKPSRAWVLNALANSVSLVDVSDPAAPSVESTIALADPSEADLKRGRIAFNSAEASSTGTFACASCHPDGHTDQLLWVLDTPLCDVGCDQIQPRLVQDIRGLRGSAPYHWDGIPGDPFGGINTANIESPVEPNCDKDVPESCTLHVLESALATTMCDQTDCETNDEGKAGRLSGADRAAMAKYLLSVPYPPSPERPYTNELTATAREGIRRFHFEKQCGNCHRLPFWTMTNMGGSGVDMPSWRGANDRWKNAIQNRFFFADLVGGDTQGFLERTNFLDDTAMFRMILEGSIGFSGALGRQVTLNREAARSSDTTELLDALEQAADEGAIVLRAEGIRLRDSGSRDLLLQYGDGVYRSPVSGDVTSYSRALLANLAVRGEALLTITARLGRLADYDHPQPTLWPLELPVLPMFPGGRPADFPELFDNEPMRMRGEHIEEGAYVLVDGRRVEGSVRCEEGALPDCADDIVIVELDRRPAIGMRLLQVQNPEGLFSNDFVFHVLGEPLQFTSGNLISSGGTFDGKGAWSAGLTSASVTWDGEADFTIDRPSPQRWRIQLSHNVAIEEGVEYSLCYSAKAEDYRYVEVGVDTGAGDYRSLMGTGGKAEVGSDTRSTGTSLTRDYHQFRHRFISPEADTTARITFDLAQSAVDVQIDDVGIYKGRGCGTP